MKRIIWFIAFLLLVPAVAQARPRRGEQGKDMQLGFGAKLGPRVSMFSGDDADSAIGEYTNRLGLAAGGFVRLGVHRYVAIQPEVLFGLKGAGLELFDSEIGSGNLSYLEVPILLRIGAPLDDRFEPHVLIGPEVAFLLDAAFEDNDGNSSNLDDDVRSMDYGLVIGAGVSYALQQGGAVGVEVRYDLGLASVDGAEDNPLDLRNRAWSFLLTYQL